MDSSRDLTIRADHDCTTWVMLITAKSRRALSKAVRERNWRKDTGCGADCTGLTFMGTCEMLRAYYDGQYWVGVVVCSEARDV